MAAVPFPAFIRQSPVKILFNPSSDSSRMSPVFIHKLDLLCFFRVSGAQIATADLRVPTNDSSYRSRLSSLVSYGLPTDLALGDDWLIP